MLKKNVVGIGRLVARSNAPPKMVALVPQDEMTGTHNEQIVAPGIQLVTLPYLDDIRHLTLSRDENIAPSEELLDAAIGLVNALDFESENFDPQQFQNPTLQKHYAHLQVNYYKNDNLKYFFILFCVYK